jgi:hypothetical protein
VNDKMIPIVNHYALLKTYEQINNVIVSGKVLNDEVKVAHFLQLDPDWKVSADSVLNYLSNLSK